MPDEPPGAAVHWLFLHTGVGGRMQAMAGQGRGIGLQMACQAASFRVQADFASGVLAQLAQ